MCLSVQPICNACRAVSGPVELHECIFRDCRPEYIEQCTRFLTWFELRNWDCDTPDCGLNMNTINSNLEQMQQVLRVEVTLPIRPAQGNSGPGNGTNTNANHNEADQILRGFDGNDSASSQPSRGGTQTGMVVLPADAPPTAALLSITVPATVVDIAPSPQPTPIPASSIRTDFDPESVDLHAFPKCKNCFRDRRRCNRQTPCDKCQQRGTPRSCGPVTLELLRRYPARAERILRLARNNGVSA